MTTPDTSPDIQTGTLLDSLDEAGRAVLFTEARTANTFTDESVSAEVLTSIWELARWAPTLANSQPLRVLFVHTPEGRARLGVHMADGNRDKTVSAPAVAVLAYDSQFYEQFPKTFPDRGEMLRSNFAKMPGEAVEDSAKYSAAIGTGVLLLAVRAHGLAAGPMAGFDAAGIDAEFFEGTTWKTHLVVNIGHPGADAWFARLPRVDQDDALAWA